MGLKQIAAACCFGVSFAASAAPPSTDCVTIDARSRVEIANRTYLGYITSPSPAINSTAAAGLSALSDALKNRTSLEPSGPMRLNIECDDLSLFPFIYWPMSKETETLSEPAQRKVQDYLDRGGFLMIDLVDGEQSTLKRVLGAVQVGRVQPLGPEHPLTYSFYLTSGLPGRQGLRTQVWAEAMGTAPHSTAATLAIGAANWTSVWAGHMWAKDSPEWERSIRAGINVVLYALTGSPSPEQRQRYDIDQRRRTP